MRWANAGGDCWPTWGSKNVVELLEKQRDLYRFINDETLRMANQGHTMTEIAENFELPKNLATFWANRGDYGTLSHNVKATYVFYLGWFDGNPATLSRDTLNKIILQETKLADAISSGDVKISGDQEKLGELVSYLDSFELWFNIVTP